MQVADTFGYLHENGHRHIYIYFVRNNGWSMYLYIRPYISQESATVCINRAILSRQGGLDVLWCISTLHLGLVNTQWKQQ